MRDKYTRKSKMNVQDVMSDDSLLTITLKTFYGIENVLKDELNELGFNEVEVLNRAVQIQGNWKDVYFLNLNCRCAISILVQIAEFDLNHEDDLYKNALKVNWPSIFKVDKSFAVKGAVFSDFFKHSQYPYLVVKDAIVDSFRKQGGERPDVNIKSPQVMFDLYIRNKTVTLSLNTSGLPLFQRGYRQSTGEAPLNEVVAAALIRISGWDKKKTLLDPFCGSGTILVEAAMMATNTAPNIERRHFAFKNFKNFNTEIWEALQEEASQRIVKMDTKVLGSDISAEMVTKARRNLRTFSFGRFVDISMKDYSEWKSTDLESVLIITNPPYGERIGTDIEELYEGVGSWMKSELPGSEVWILSGSELGLKSIGLKPSIKNKLFNGDIECSFRKYELFTGSLKEQKQVVNE